LQQLLRFGLPPSSADYDARSGLHLAAALGRVRMAEMLLDAGADASACDNFGVTPLLEACRAGQDGVAELLRKAGGTLGPKGADGAELCAAAFNGKLEYMRRLLESGYAADAADYDKRSAAHLACAEGRTEVALLLLRWGADFEAQDRWGNTPLREATANGHKALAGVLMAEREKAARQARK
jgi:ankyrin repeat protein